MNLQMLGGINYVEDDIAKFLRRSGDGLFGDDVTLLTESENELLARIKQNEDQGIRTTLKNLLEKFERKPYGWPLCSRTLHACQTLRAGQGGGHGG